MGAKGHLGSADLPVPTVRFHCNAGLALCGMKITTSDRMLHYTILFGSFFAAS